MTFLGRHIRKNHRTFLKTPGRPGVPGTPSQCPGKNVSFSIENNRKSLGHRPVDPCLSRQGVSQGFSLSLCALFFPEFSDFFGGGAQMARVAHGGFFNATPCALFRFGGGDIFLGETSRNISMQQPTLSFAVIRGSSGTKIHSGKFCLEVEHIGPCHLAPLNCSEHFGGSRFVSLLFTSRH